VKNILLVDDDPGVREVLGRVLESENYRVKCATNEREATAAFRAEPPELVLLDLSMPGSDGWTAFRHMNEIHPFIPIIVITARPNQYRQAVDLAVDALMEKPLDLPVLLEAIRGFISETEVERTRRLINPDFKTTFLKITSNPADLTLV
jgi:DNA-binding response OmpR family regulator